MNKKTKLFALVSGISLTLATLVSFFAKPSLATKAEAPDWANFTLEVDEGTYQKDQLAANTTLKFKINTGSNKLTYADTATAFGGQFGYYNDHRDATTDGNGNRLIDYICINGDSIAKIIEDNIAGKTSFDGSAYYAPFPYGSTFCPLIFRTDENYFYCDIMKEYLDYRNITIHEVRVEIKAGAAFRDSNYAAYVMDKNVSAVIPAGAGEPEHFVEMVDQGSTASDGYLYVRDTQAVTTRGMTGALLWFNRPLTEYAGLWILDHKNAFSAYITINGKSIEQWNVDNDDSTWDYSGCQLAGGTDPSVCYNRPFSISVDGNSPQAVYLGFHPNILAQFTAGQEMTIGVKKGFSYKSGDSWFYQAETVENAYTYTPTGSCVLTPEKANYGTVSGDFTENALEIKSTSYKTIRDYAAADYHGINIRFKQSLSYMSCYDVVDGNDSIGFNVRVAKYITINGTSVADINATVDDSAYTYTPFPHSVGGCYAVPVMIRHDGADTLNLMIHPTYIATLGDSITLGIKAGLTIYDAARPTGTTKLICHGVYKLATSSSVTVNISTDKYVVSEFVSRYMYMDTYTTEQGYCSDSEHHYYSDAKSAWNGLTAAQKTIFATDSDFADAYARFVAWAAANGYTVNGTSVVATRTNVVMESNPSSIIIVSILVVISVAGVALLLKKKHN